MSQSNFLATVANTLENYEIEPKVIKYVTAKVRESFINSATRYLSTTWRLASAPTSGIFSPVTKSFINLKETFSSIFVPGFKDEKSAIDFSVNSAISYSPVIRFTLDNKVKRTFIAERYCFLGSIDDWIYIGGPDSLNNLLKKYSKHLGKESFFDFY